VLIRSSMPFSFSEFGRTKLKNIAVELDRKKLRGQRE